MAAILPEWVAHDILMWAFRDLNDVPLRVTLTKVKLGGAPHVEADVSQRYRRRRPIDP